MRRTAAARTETDALVDWRTVQSDSAAPADEVDRLSALKLAQERLDLQGELDAMTPEYDLDELAAEFVEVAANYSQRQGLS